ncbi:MAG: hypothetical protein ACYCTB_04045 [bacterium]
MPIEIFKIALKLYKHWIPAFAEMTPAACRKAKCQQSHSCVGRKVPKETSRGYKPRAKRSSRKIIFYRQFSVKTKSFIIYNINI